MIDTATDIPPYMQQIFANARQSGAEARAFEERRLSGDAMAQMAFEVAEEISGGMMHAEMSWNGKRRTAMKLLAMFEAARA